MRDGRLLWANRLTEDNIEKCFEAVKQALDGKRFTVVTVNSLFGHRPEVRVHQELRDGVNLRGYEDKETGEVRHHIDVTDANYVTSISPGWREERPTDVVVHEQSVLVEHYAPSGNHLWWSWTVEEDPQPA